MIDTFSVDLSRSANLAMSKLNYYLLKNIVPYKFLKDNSNIYLKHYGAYPLKSVIEDTITIKKGSNKYMKTIEIYFGEEENLGNYFCSGNYIEIKYNNELKIAKLVGAPYASLKDSAALVEVLEKLAEDVKCKENFFHQEKNNVYVIRQGIHK